MENVEYLYTKKIQNEFTYFYEENLYHLYIIKNGEGFRLYNPINKFYTGGRTSALLNGDASDKFLLARFPLEVLNWLRKIMFGLLNAQDKNVYAIFKGDYSKYEPFDYHCIFGKITFWLREDGDLAGIVIPENLMVFIKNEEFSTFKENCVLNVENGNLWKYIKFRQEFKKNEYRKSQFKNKAII